MAGPEGEPDTGPSPYPAPGSARWEGLRVCWGTHHEKLIGDGDKRCCWGWRVFENGENPKDVSNKLSRVYPESDG